MKDEVHDMLCAIIDAHGPHRIAFELMKIIDEKAVELSGWQEITMAKRWAACAPAAIALEAVMLQQFGE